MELSTDVAGAERSDWSEAVDDTVTRGNNLLVRCCGNGGRKVVRCRTQSLDQAMLGGHKGSETDAGQGIRDRRWTRDQRQTLDKGSETDAGQGIRDRRWTRDQRQTLDKGSETDAGREIRDRRWTRDQRQTLDKGSETDAGQGIRDRRWTRDQRQTLEG
ncbi:hypothetical protein GUITHDRAFT_144966 [Guillardia theta CCMP2712]|uniref:Uncharacterized protein n=1 Tax=Guillardia theta (strain CCMP2712) TaxID=905079 RepID=L1IN80_GUITC|nr:hypothetical protein GUITHDRAFT_144966 [Guillardia theta CCMP2712]EKX37552.1 hypothetical protein GUITHDRAFT_144966 [Guillardia theta CCMP2712]|eukprot:XP_005824532.1 hypothetical protein GUITHDRAFT_144966 [Guillardia theta CCMP2712]